MRVEYVRGSRKQDSNKLLEDKLQIIKIAPLNTERGCGCARHSQRSRKHAALRFKTRILPVRRLILDLMGYPEFKGLEVERKELSNAYLVTQACRNTSLPEIKYKIQSNWNKVTYQSITTCSISWSRRFFWTIVPVIRKQLNVSKA